MLSDFLADAETLRERLRSLAGRGAGLHLLQVFDPAEEAFPYEGRLEFRDPESGDTWLTERAGGLRDDYRARLEAHRELIRGFAPAGRLLLRRPPHRPAGRRGPALPAGAALRRRRPARTSRQRDSGASGGMIGSLGFLSPWILVALAALPLIWLILRLTPPRPRQVEFPPTRILLGLRGPRAHAGAHALVADAAPPAPRRARHRRARRADPPPGPEADRRQRAAARRARQWLGRRARFRRARRRRAKRRSPRPTRDGRPVSFVATAEPRAESLAAGEPPTAAERRLAAIVPRPYLPDRAALAPRLDGSVRAERSVEVALGRRVARRRRRQRRSPPPLDRDRRARHACSSRRGR